MEETDIIIIGAGVIGLAIAACVSRKDRNVIVVEKNPTFGQEASSRNSEIIHSGIYYPPNSLKAKLCVEGRHLLYQFCEEQDIPYKRSGKLIVATNDKEAKELEALIDRGKKNAVENLSLLAKEQIKKIEPNIRAICAIHSPSTGIVDTHQFMKRLQYLAKDRKVIFAYNCEVIGIEEKTGGYQVDIRDADGEKLTLFTRILINSAGLNSERIARMAGMDIKKSGYELHYSKGEYFRVKANKSKLVNRLIYPTPKETFLGIHTVADIQGEMKLGPNAFYVEEIDYDVDPTHKYEFYESTKRFLPFIELDDLSPDVAGIRAKLQAPGEPVADFVISHEEEKGFPGLINIIGIESPGFTASLAIANYVGSMI